MFKLRDYQLKTINKIYDSIKSGHKKIIVQQPPRTGKTVIMAEIARRTTLKGNRLLFLIHRKEVLEQAINTFKQQEVDMELATMGMVQTLYRKVNRLPEPQLILIDEAHHAAAKTYQTILNAFPNAFVLLFTATPIRTGKKQLDQVADDIIVGESIKNLISQGYLANFKYFARKDVDTKKLKKSSTGDFTNASMEEAVSTKIYGHVLDNYLRIAKGKQAVVFTYSVESAKRIAKQFNSAGITAEELDGNTDTATRESIVNDFRNKKITILVNVNLFTEGVDLPDVDCVIMTRPTASLALYLQFSMRCLNPRKGKTAIIIDHVGNYERFGLPNSERDWRTAIVTKDKKTKKKQQNDSLSIVQCDFCFRVFERSDIKNGTCPGCGNPIKVRKAPEVTNDQLQEVIQDRKNLVEKIISDNTKLAIAGKKLSELHTYKELKAYADLHGYRPGWIFYQLKNRKRGH